MRNVSKCAARYTIFWLFCLWQRFKVWIVPKCYLELMLCLIILVLSWLKQDRDRERSVAEGNYHLMIFCFFLFQEPLALHAPEVNREVMCACVRTCVCAYVRARVHSGGWVICYVKTKDKRITQGHKLKPETATFLTVNNYWQKRVYQEKNSTSSTIDYRRKDESTNNVSQFSFQLSQYLVN